MDNKIQATLKVEYHDTYADMRERTKLIRRYNELVRRGVRDAEYDKLRKLMIELGQVKK